jgi:dephospho-CoA kinase
MKVIGLAGGSGTGKSAIASHLAGRGARHIDADKIGHDLLRGDPGIIRAVRDAFGEDVFSDGVVDRRKLGRVVFGDSRRLGTLNAILHPAVLEACRRMILQLEEDGTEMVVVDAALLLEVEFPFEFDLVIALRAPRVEQEKRLLAKGGASRDEIAARLDSQARLERSFEDADVVLDTTGPLHRVLAEVDRIVDGLVSKGR